jgi:hypothetical protein
VGGSYLYGCRILYAIPIFALQIRVILGLTNAFLLRLKGNLVQIQARFVLSLIVNNDCKQSDSKECSEA